MNNTVSVDSNRAKQLLHSTIALGQQTRPIMQLLVRQALIEADRATFDGSKFNTVKNDFKKLADEAKKAVNFVDVERFLIGDLSRQYGLDRLCQEEMLSGRLVPTVAGFLEGHSLKPLSMSILQETASDVAVRIRGADGDGATLIYETIGAVLDWDNAISNEQAINDFLGKLGVGSATHFTQFLNTGVLDAKAATELLSSQLMQEVANKLNPKITAAATAFMYADTLVEAANGFKFTWGPPQSGDTSSLKAGVGALSGILGLMGESGAAAEVEKASNFFQSAAQIEQSASLLLAGASGWGAALAISGLVSGVAGLGAFGLADGAGANGPGADTQATLEAIANLQAIMMAEFTKVNQKLAEITKQLDVVLNEIRKGNLMVERVIGILDDVDRKLDLLMLRADRGAQLVIDELQRTENLRCLAEGYEGDITNSRLSACIAFYARLAEEASTVRVFPADLGTYNDALRQLDLVFSATAQQGSDSGSDASNQDAWRSAAVLKRVLAEMGISLPGLGSNEPILVAAITNLTELYHITDGHFHKLKQQEMVRASVKKVRVAAIQHERFVRSLRGDSIEITDQRAIAPGLDGSPVLSELVKRIEVSLETFAKGCKKLRDEILLDDLVEKLAAGNAPFAARAATAEIRNPQGIGGAFTILVPSSDLPKDAALRLMLTCIRPSSGADNLRIELVSFRILEEHRDTEYPRLFVRFEVDAFLYGERVMPTLEMSTQLLFDDYTWEQVQANRHDGISLLAMARQKVGAGSGGSERLAERIADHIRGQDKNAPAEHSANIWNVQRRRLKSTRDDLDRAFATALQGPEQDWKGAGPDIRSIYDAKDYAIALRAALRLAFGDAYNSCDILPAAFQGSAAFRLMDVDLLRVWCRNRISLIDYGKFNPKNPEHRLTEVAPEVEAMKRLSALKSVLASFIDTAREAGGSLGFESAKARLRELVSGYKIEGPDVPGSARLLPLPRCDTRSGESAPREGLHNETPGTSGTR